MDKISISLNPIFWRLLIWRSYSGLLIIGIAALISVVTPAPSFAQAFSTRMIPGFLGIFIAQVIMSLIEWFNKRLHIEIKEGKIIGSKSGLFNGSQKIYLRDLERTSLLQKGSYQKYFGAHKLCSTRDEVIMFAPFVYGKRLVDEFYKALETIQEENLKNKKQKAIDWREK
jgi:hypothetical protein